jgi:hypothetical protein
VDEDDPKPNMVIVEAGSVTGGVLTQNVLEMYK